jgi:hypothetical protein
VIQLEAANARAALSVGDRHVRVELVAESAAGAFLGQMKADCRAFHGLAGFAGNLNGQRAQAARAGSVYGAIALNYLDVENGHLAEGWRDSRPNPRGQ